MTTAGFAEEFIAGKDYEIVQQSRPSSLKANKVSVVEFFSYGCPWCYHLDSALMEWVTQHKERIQFSRIPVVFNKNWIFYAKAYHTLHLLGLEKKLNTVLFHAIQDENRSLMSDSAMIDFLMAQGVDKNLVTSAFEHSTTMDMQIQEDMQAMTQFHISGIPAVVINNQYKLDLKMAQNQERFFKILNFLISKKG